MESLILLFIFVALMFTGIVNGIFFLFLTLVKSSLGLSEDDVEEKAKKLKSAKKYFFVSLFSFSISLGTWIFFFRLIGHN